MEMTYNERVGERLRYIRKQKKLSLQAVEQKSHQAFKASVLGAYERGERAISVPRLQGLAQFYNVPVDQLLPVDPEAAARDDTSSRPARREREDGVMLDLTRVEQLDSTELDAVSRYVMMIQMQRQDFNGKVLTIRRDDLRALAYLHRMTGDQLESRLEQLGVTGSNGPR